MLIAQCCSRKPSRRSPSGRTVSTWTRRSVAAGTVARSWLGWGRQGRLIALDRDPQAVAAARAIADPRLSIVHAPFAALSSVAGARGAAASTACCSTSGVSSPQLDDAGARIHLPRRRPARHAHGHDARGVRRGVARTGDEQEIREVIGDYGEERFAKQIAAAIVAARAREPIVRTRQLAEIVARAVRTREPGQDPATRTFQALRIHVNQELEELAVMLPQAVRAPRAGRAARGDQLPFARGPHREALHARAGAIPRCPGDCRCARAKCHSRRSQLWDARSARVAAEETAANPRARSAVLRVAERTAAPLDPALLPNRARRVAKLNLLLLAGSRRLRARARHLAAQGAQALHRSWRASRRARASSRWSTASCSSSRAPGGCTRASRRSPRARSACARPIRAACAGRRRAPVGEQARAQRACAAPAGVARAPRAVRASAPASRVLAARAVVPAGAWRPISCRRRAKRATRA